MLTLCVSGKVASELEFTSYSNFRSNTNKQTKQVIQSEKVNFMWHLDKRLEERNMGIRGLSRLTGIPHNAIANYSNNDVSASTLNIEHVIAIMIALRLTSMEQLVTVEMPHGTAVRFGKESSAWMETGEVPSSVVNLSAQ